jgi:hypothetical protein
MPGAFLIVATVACPYPNPATVAANDLSWLEHALMFLYKV